MSNFQKAQPESIKGPFEVVPPTRRKYPRKAYRKTLSFICRGVSQVVEGIEIGEGGLSFKSDLVLDKEQKLVVNFFLTGAGFFSVPATLRNTSEVSDHFIYGVSFDEVDISLKRKIRSFVATSP